MTGHEQRHRRTGASSRRRLFVAVVGACSLVAFGASAAADVALPVADDHLAAAPTTAVGDATGVGDTPPSEPPEGLGDDPELDVLAQECYDGELVSCDLLYLQSPIDSDYERYGDTCAGRQEAGTENLCGLGWQSAPDGPDGPDDTTPDGPDDTTPDGTIGEPVAPGNLGDDPELDALAQRCYEGDMAACDDLYFAADIDSDYMIYGDTCAGRQAEHTGQTCTELDVPAPPDTTVDTGVDTTVAQTGAIPPAGAEPTGLGSDPALDALAQQCYEGDMAACDELFNSAEAGTPYRSYGDTCAGRQPESSGAWCRTAFGDATPTTNVPVPTNPPATAPPLTAPPPTVPITTMPVPTVPVAPTVPTLPVPGGSTLPPSTVVGAIPPATQQPTGLGTNPTLDALAQQCFDGDMVACDELYRQSDAELELSYRDYGDTCAGRQPLGTGRWCESSFPATGVSTTTGVPTTGVPTVPTVPAPGTNIPPATQDPSALGTDPTLNELAQRCYNGEMQACDDLFLQSDIGTPYHTYGDTCAGRQPQGTYTYCHVAFPT